MSINKKPLIHLTREDIQSVDDIKIEEVEASEWGGPIFVKGMTAKVRARLEVTNVKTRGNDQTVNMTKLRERIAIATVCDKDGKLLFTKADEDWLGEKSAAVLDRIVLKAYSLSGMSEDDTKEMTEEMEENPFGDSAID